MEKIFVLDKKYFVLNKIILSRTNLILSWTKNILSGQMDGALVLNTNDWKSLITKERKDSSDGKAKKYSQCLPRVCYPQKNGFVRHSVAVVSLL